MTALSEAASRASAPRRRRRLSSVDKRRNGSVIGKGAGVLVLETKERDRAPCRGVRGLSGLGAPPTRTTSPRPRRTVRALLGHDARAARRGLEPRGVELGQRPRHLHSAQRPVGDRGDQDRPWRPRREGPGLVAEVSDRHLLGAAGAVEAVATMLALREQVVPPTPGWEERGDGMDLDYVPGRRDRWRATAARPRAISNSSARRPQRRPVLRGRVSAALETSHDGALAPLERLKRLYDPGSLRPFRSEVASRAKRTNVPGDGMVTAAGTLGGRPVFSYSQDRSVLGRSLGESQAGASCGCCASPATPMRRWSASSSPRGARVDEGTAGLGGYGRIFSEHVRLRRQDAPDHGDHRHLGRGRACSPL